MSIDSLIYIYFTIKYHKHFNVSSACLRMTSSEMGSCTEGFETNLWKKKKHFIMIVFIDIFRIENLGRGPSCFTEPLLTLVLWH